MQADFDAHLPSADVNIVGMNQAGDEAANPDMAEKSDLPLLQDVDVNDGGQPDGDSDVWTEYGAAWRDVVVVDRDGELSDVLVNLSSNDLREATIYDQVKADITAFVTRNNVAKTDWQNRIEPLDVTNDGFVSPADVLANVIEINTNGARQLEVAPAEVTEFYDVDGDGWLAPKDVLWTVIHLNRDTGASGEPSNNNAATEAVFASLQAAYQSQQDDDES